MTRDGTHGHAEANTRTGVFPSSTTISSHSTMHESQGIFIYWRSFIKFNIIVLPPSVCRAQNASPWRNKKMQRWPCYTNERSHQSSNISQHPSFNSISFSSLSKDSLMVTMRGTQLPTILSWMPLTLLQETGNVLPSTKTHLQSIFSLLRDIKLNRSLTPSRLSPVKAIPAIKIFRISCGGDHLPITVCASDYLALLLGVGLQYLIRERVLSVNFYASSYSAMLLGNWSTTYTAIILIRLRIFTVKSVCLPSIFLWHSVTTLFSIEALNMSLPFVQGERIIDYHCIQSLHRRLLHDRFIHSISLRCNR